MPAPKLIVPEPLSLRNHPDFSEKWLEDQIVENPSILKLGEVEVRGRQRMQPRAGRLDLLLEDTESRKRYEVELQLGKTDESHLIRTIEYWDIERKRYPQYEHCAVVVAEDITSRFLNIIGLFNGIIPLIAIQLHALRVGDGVVLVFTKVLDELEFGLEEPEGPEKVVRSRADWEARVPKSILQVVDSIYEAVKALDPSYELNYKKYFIGLARSGIANNFVHFRPKQRFVKFTFKLDQSDELEKQIETSGIELIGYEKKWREYTLRLTPNDYAPHKDLLTQIVKLAYAQNTRE